MKIYNEIRGLCLKTYHRVNISSAQALGWLQTTEYNGEKVETQTFCGAWFGYAQKQANSTPSILERGGPNSFVWIWAQNISWGNEYVVLSLTLNPHIYGNKLVFLTLCKVLKQPRQTSSVTERKQASKQTLVIWDDKYIDGSESNTSAGPSPGEGKVCTISGWWGGVCCFELGIEWRSGVLLLFLPLDCLGTQSTCRLHLCSDSDLCSVCPWSQIRAAQTFCVWEALRKTGGA